MSGRTPEPRVAVFIRKMWKRNLRANTSCEWAGDEPPLRSESARQESSFGTHTSEAVCCKSTVPDCLESESAASIGILGILLAVDDGLDIRRNRRKTSPCTRLID